MAATWCGLFRLFRPRHRSTAAVVTMWPRPIDFGGGVFSNKLSDGANTYKVPVSVGILSLKRPQCLQLDIFACIIFYLFLFPLGWDKREDSQDTVILSFITLWCRWEKCKTFFVYTTSNLWNVLIHETEILAPFSNRKYKEASRLYMCSTSRVKWILLPWPLFWCSYLVSSSLWLQVTSVGQYLFLSFQLSEQSFRPCYTWNCVH